VRRRLLLALAVLVGAGAAYVFREPILFRIGSYLIADGARRPADSIVVLAGSTPDRILEAIDLYQQGLAPRIVLTRGSESPGIEQLRRRGVEMAEPHEQNRSIALQLGVPETAIEIVEGGAGGTVTEAKVVVDRLRQIGTRSALIVTSKIHTRRAGWIYRGIAGDEIDITTCASRYDDYDPATWWRRRGHTRRVVIEYQKLLVYWVRDSW
jgi:uncharacterized SAM-binding protein YcdF (DUF218 family)